MPPASKTRDHAASATTKNFHYRHCPGCRSTVSPYQPRGFPSDTSNAPPQPPAATAATLLQIPKFPYKPCLFRETLLRLLRVGASPAPGGWPHGQSGRGQPRHSSVMLAGNVCGLVTAQPGGTSRLGPSPCRASSMFCLFPPSVNHSLLGPLQARLIFRNGKAKGPGPRNG